MRRAAARTRALRLLGEIVGVAMTAVYGPPRQGDIRHSVADVTQAQAGLDFRAQTPFAAGLRATVEWYSCTLDIKHSNKDISDDTN